MKELIGCATKWQNQSLKNGAIAEVPKTAVPKITT